MRARFANDPEGALRNDLNLTVSAVEHLAHTRTDGGACDGVSFLEDGVILYAPTPGSRRQNFTLAHELGHWLAERAPDIYDWLADQDEPGRLLETVCDRIAQTLLLPETAAARVVGQGPLRAQHLVDLYNATQASRPVCAIALANQLQGLGAVVIIDRRSTAVTHASVKPDPERGWPTVFPWRGQHLTDTHPLLQLVDGRTMTRRLPWQTPWGSRADFYVDAVADESRVFAVFSSADLWNTERFHAPDRRDFDTRPALSGFCCGSSFELRGYPCPDCKKPYCPRCGKCPCQKDTQTMGACTNCFLQLHPNLITNGLCVECRS
ncbi:ImmA/IrrE family metallo-endopeptidase [Arthrobacter sp. SW1]|uniref:ImmA/IrrE family metallo-endopeptidase n=1 Tax=Arthrobacter sp. SW1 TaxID=1920889 RepID=UPI000943042C